MIFICGGDGEVAASTSCPSSWFPSCGGSPADNSESESLSSDSLEESVNNQLFLIQNLSLPEQFTYFQINSFGPCCYKLETVANAMTEACNNLSNIISE